MEALVLGAGIGGGFLMTHWLEGQKGSGAAVLRVNTHVRLFLRLAVLSPGFCPLRTKAARAVKAGAPATVEVVGSRADL